MGLKTCFVILVSVLCGVHALKATDKIWYEGTLVLKSNEVLEGEISYQSAYDVIFFRISDIVEVIPAHKIKSFAYYDEQAYRRNFVSVLKTKGASRRYEIFEIILQGEISVFRKHHSYITHLSEVNNPPEVEYEYFAYYNNEFIAMYRFKSKLYSKLVKANEVPLKEYAQKNKLNPNFYEDAIELIEYFNDQRADQAVLAGF